MLKVIHEGKLIGVKISKIPEGSVPQTEENEPLQIVTLKHPQGTTLPAHAHLPKQRITSKLQECMVIKKGKVKLDIYTKEGELVENLILKKGESFLLIEGGIGVNFLKDSEIIEIKNGPFIEDKILI